MFSPKGKGLYLAIEVLVADSRRKDLNLNVECYARLGISEYFVFEPVSASLHTFRLSPETEVYEGLVPQFGRFECRVLGLEIATEGRKLRFIRNDATLLATWQHTDRLSQSVDELGKKVDAELQRAEAEAQRAEAEAQLADREAARADGLEAKLAEALKRAKASPSE
jgi:hypothetical protein